MHFTFAQTSGRLLRPETRPASNFCRRAAKAAAAAQSLIIIINIHSLLLPRRLFSHSPRGSSYRARRNQQPAVDLFAAAAAGCCLQIVVGRLWGPLRLRRQQQNWFQAPLWRSCESREKNTAGEDQSLVVGRAQSKVEKAPHLPSPLKLQFRRRLP